MIMQHYTFAALESLLAFLKTAYPSLHITIEEDKPRYIVCGSLEIKHSHKGYEVTMFHGGSTRCYLGGMGVEQIADLIYILIQNKESFIMP